MASIEVEMKADFLEEAAFLMGLEEGGLGSEETKEDVLGGRDPENKGVESEKCGTRAKRLSLSRGGAGSTAGAEDRQEGSPSLPSIPVMFLLQILMFRGLGSNVRTAVPTALTRCPAHNRTGGSRVLVHGLTETPARSVWRKVGQEGHQGGVPPSLRAGCPQIAERQTSNRQALAGSRNRLNIAARRQERHPVVVEQMGEQGVGSEGNGKSPGGKVGRPQMF